jgi:hypothetical protein
VTGQTDARRRGIVSAAFGSRRGLSSPLPAPLLLIFFYKLMFYMDFIPSDQICSGSRPMTGMEKNVSGNKDAFQPFCAMVWGMVTKKNRPLPVAASHRHRPISLTGGNPWK